MHGRLEWSSFMVTGMKKEGPEMQYKDGVLRQAEWPEIRTDFRFSSSDAGRSLVLYSWLYRLGMHEMHEKMSGW
jgi:hypothetical protein